MRFQGALSFDIEDWYHSELLPPAVKEAPPESIVRDGTLRILDVLARHGVRATFFVLGDIVRRHPDLLRRIAGDGHEIASHGLDHRPLWELDAAALRAQLRDFRAIVEDVLGEFPVLGYRAPCFSLDARTTWALDVLTECGYAYDSSVFPARVKMYGVPDAPVAIYRPARGDVRRHDATRSLIEFPVAVCALGPVRLPAAGGFYLRVLPFPVLRAALDAIGRRRPFALYLHPREFRPERTRAARGLVNSFIWYTRLDSVVAKVDRLATRYRLGPMRDVLADAGWLAPGTATDTRARDGV